MSTLKRLLFGCAFAGSMMLAPVAFAAPKETQVAIPVLGVFTALPINVPVDAALMVAATLAAFFWLYSIFI